MATRAKVGKGLHVRRVASREDRKRPSVWMSLKTDESFNGYALFEPDPEMEDNPGYFEYYVHNDQQAKRYVPCAGENCPFCAANDAPGTRALTAWYFPERDPGEQIKLFEMNWSTVQALDDEAEDEDGIQGKRLRIKRLTDKGEYRVKVRSGPENKPLTQTQLKKVMAELEEKFDLGDVVERRLKAELERMRAVDALDEDDDDYDDEDEEETPKAKRTGKAQVETEDEEDEDEDEEDENEADEEDEAEEEDEDEDEDEEADEDEEDEDEDAEEMSGKFTVTRVADEEAGIINVTGAEGEKYKMFAAEDLDIDYDEITKGVEVSLSAQADDEGDWIITEIEVAKPKSRRTSLKPKASSRRSR